MKEIKDSLLLFKITNSSENQSHSVFRIPDLAHWIWNAVRILITLLQNR